MRIKVDTIEALKAQGITVANYPNETYEEWLQECWQKEYDWHQWYDKNFDRTEEEKDKRAKEWADRNAARKANNWYDAEVLYIRYEDKLICKKVRVKSELITEEFVKKLIEKDRKAYSGPYGDFALKMKQLLSRKKLGRSMWVYPTTYGIGIWVFYNWDEKQCIEAVSAILDEAGIQYRNEYSDAQYVYRYIVSKAEANRLKIDKA